MNGDIERPDPAALLRRITAEGRRRTLFRIHLGYARGAGATTNMLDEARRRGARGTDVVVASHRVHGSPAAALRDLALLGGGRHPPGEHRLDVDAVLARNPEVVCIDDLADADRAGRPRVEAVPALLDAGITVLATVHVLSLRSVALAFAERAGSVACLIDDAVLSAADELEMADITPDALLQRLREHRILAPHELARAMQLELRPNVLAALRETAFRVIGEHTDRQLVGYMRENATPAWDVRGRIVVALPVQPGLEDRIRRAHAYAAAQDAKFSVVSVRVRQQSEVEKGWMGAYAAMTHQLGGEFVHLHDGSVASALASYVRESLATEIILGHRRRSRWRPGDTTSELIRKLSGVDVHIVRDDSGRD